MVRFPSGLSATDIPPAGNFRCRPKSQATREAISRGMRAAVAEGRHHPRGGSAYLPPPEFQDIYEDLRRKCGASKARRLVEDHAAVIARRRARAVQGQP